MADTWKCNCGATNIVDKCYKCSSTNPSIRWECEACGHNNHIAKDFCDVCLNKKDKPTITTVDETTNPKDLLAIKKPPIELVPPIQEILTSLAFKDGAEKYGPFNWRTKKVRYSIYYAAAIRHMKQAYDGEDVDDVSKVMHIAHASACIAILMDAWATGNLIDDRPVKGASSEIINQFADKGCIGE